MPAALFIHIGAHKTGTSFLHRELCHIAPQLALQGCHYESSAVHLAKALLARGANTDCLTVEKLRRELDLSLSLHNLPRALLVSEHFMGNPHTGYAEAADIARSLAAVCQGMDVRILISVRRQDTFIESWYGQSIKEGGFWSFEEFLASWPCPGPDWDKIVGDYENAFGPDRVRVVSYEQAFASPEAILDSHFLGWFYDQSIQLPASAAINPSLSADGLEIARHANRLLSSHQKNEIRRVLESCSSRGSRPFNLFTPEARVAWLEACAPGNRRLAARHPAVETTLLAAPSPALHGIQNPPSSPVRPDADLPEIAAQVIKLVDQHYRERCDALRERCDTFRERCDTFQKNLRTAQLEAETKEKATATAHAAEIADLTQKLECLKNPFSTLALAITRMLPTRRARKGDRSGRKEIQRLQKALQRQTDRLNDANRLLSRLRPAEGLDLVSKFESRPFPSDGSVVFATTIDDAFAPGLECLVHTLCKQHPGIRVPFYVFHDDSLLPGTIDYLRFLYPAFEFRRVDPADYAGIEPHKRIGHASYRIFEAFRLPGPARVIALDADILCLNPIGGLLDIPDDIFAASLNVGENLIPYTLADSPKHVFNSGVMHIPASVRGETTFQELVRLAREGAGKDDPAIARFADQRVLNYYFKNRPFSPLGLSYNANVKLGAVHVDFSLKRVGLLHFTGPKPWTLDPKKTELDDNVRPLHQLWHKLYQEARLAHRTNYFKSSGALARIEELRNVHAGKRAFILGNGPSLRHQDLSLLKNEITFAGNWFALHDRYAEIDPRYYCLCSHTIFGGWDVAQPKLDDNLHKLLLDRTANAIKFFSFDVRDCLESASPFPGHDLRYLLYEKPLKRFIDSVEDFNLDPALPLHDGHTVVVTFALFLAHWMGIKEIYLLGCDCDYGIKKETDEKQYFYDSSLHTTKTSAFEHLQKVWTPEGGRIFKTYEIVRDILAKKDVKVYNATHGGCLEVFPRRSYESLFKT